MKKQTNIARKQYQGLHKVYEFDKKKKDKAKDIDKTKNKKRVKSNLFYSDICFSKTAVLKSLLIFLLPQNKRI